MLHVGAGLVGTILSIPSLVRYVLFLLVGIAGVAGAILAAATRDDAYDAADRYNKWAWVAILAGSALVCIFQFPFVAWFGAVAVGIYFFDVRPQITDIVRGNYGW